MMDAWDPTKIAMRRPRAARSDLRRGRPLGRVSVCIECELTRRKILATIHTSFDDDYRSSSSIPNLSPWRATPLLNT